MECHRRKNRKTKTDKKQKKLISETTVVTKNVRNFSISHKPPCKCFAELRQTYGSLIFYFFSLVQPLQATRAAEFANGVKVCKGRATTKSGCTST